MFVSRDPRLGMETELVDQDDTTATLKTTTRPGTHWRGRRLFFLCLLLAGIAAFIAVEQVASRVAATRPVTVYLLGDPHQEWTHLIRETFRALGCQVESLPLDRSPEGLPADMIVFGSEASGSIAYRTYKDIYAGALTQYVSRGGLLVHLAQRPEVEPQPPFLTQEMEAHRLGPEISEVFLLAADHPLIAGLEEEGLSTLSATPQISRAFTQPRGFQVILAADRLGHYPVLMEGALGRGRIVLSALSLDRAPQRVRKQFFANLVQDADAFRRGQRRGVWPTTTSDTYQSRHSDSWTLVLLPDTQKYARHYPGILLGQTAWIAQIAGRCRIRYALHLGDMTETNRREEWMNVRDAMALMDGKLPYTVCTGNHDYGPQGESSDRVTLLNEMFPVDRFAEWPTFGGVMEPGRMDNSFHRFAVGTDFWLVLVLEWAPRDETVAWANRIMSTHPDHKGILVTHAYVDRDSTRIDHHAAPKMWSHNPHDSQTPGSINDGQELWEKLVSKHDFRFVFSGHILGQGTGYVASRNDLGRTVHQMASNYQHRELGGQGYLRLLEFYPDRKTVGVRTYSPILGRFLLGDTQQFELVLD